MSQNVEAAHRQPRDAAHAQPCKGPHVEIYRNSAESSFNQSPCRGTPSERPQCDGARLSQRDLDETKISENDTANPLITVLMPCLNEAGTLAACIDQAHAGCRAALASRNLGRNEFASGLSCRSPLREPRNDELAAANASKHTYEILVADNGSTDGSAAIASEHGARVVHVANKGYGAALLGGIAASRSKYVIMGDCDCSYDFGEITQFLSKLEEGYHLVIGNRFAGGIKPGAMPLHHRYLGNPLLSGIGSLLYRTTCRDWHCGIRGFDRRIMQQLNLKCRGMEFASEMILRAAQADLKITETPVTLWPDKRSRPPHLRSIRDGLRHLWLLCAGKLF